jgi:gluconolactonase
MSNIITRRSFVAGISALAPSLALAQAARPILGAAPSVVSQPPRQWGDSAPPDYYPDPDILIIDRSFSEYVYQWAGIRRLGTGFQWAEGPAWSSEGQYVVFSDVAGNTQYRYVWDDGRITPFRRPSFNGNGNSFDFQGRQLSCQHFLRRVVRWELDGSMTVIADSFEGKPLNSPNDIVPHPDGSIWFTDPPYGDALAEGHPDEAGGMANPNGLYNPALGNSGVGIIGGLKRALPANTYRWDPSGRLEIIISAEQDPHPNGLCFSPDYKTLYFMNSTIYAFDVQGSKLSNMRPFTNCVVDGVTCSPDGFRADKAGNIWVGSNAPLGYGGVTVWNPAGKLIGRIRLPEVCANVCFAGPKRDYLFMCASQSVYMVRVGIQGAAPG